MGRRRAVRGLPGYLRFELDRTAAGPLRGKMEFMCSCGHAECGSLWPHLMEDDSAAEIQCPVCRKFYQLRASRED